MRASRASSCAGEHMRHDAKPLGEMHRLQIIRVNAASHGWPGVHAENAACDVLEVNVPTFQAHVSVSLGVPLAALTIRGRWAACAVQWPITHLRQLCTASWVQERLSGGGCMAC